MYLLDMLLQVPHSALTAVILDEYIDCAGLQNDISVLETRGFLSLRTEVLVRNDGLLVSYVSTDFEDLHTVKQRRGDSIEVVG